MHRSSNRTIVVFSVLFLVICLLIVHETKAQYGMPSDTLRGVVVEQDEQGRFQPLPMAHVYWMGTQRGTTTNGQGLFALPAHPETRQLVVRYTGYAPDTLVHLFTSLIMLLRR